MADIQLRDVPEQVVLTEQRTVGTAALQDWLRDAMDRQYTSALSLGGPAGPIFVIYHGSSPTTRRRFRSRCAYTDTRSPTPHARSTSRTSRGASAASS